MSLKDPERFAPVRESQQRSVQSQIRTRPASRTSYRLAGPRIELRPSLGLLQTCLLPVVQHVRYERARFLTRNVQFRLGLRRPSKR